METSRTDIQRDKRQTKCFNSSLVGYSTYTLRYGDVFVFRYKGEETTHTAKCHGRVRPTTGGQWFILAQQLSDNLQFSYERWIKPEDVIEIIPKNHANRHLLCMFEEYENNHIIYR